MNDLMSDYVARVSNAVRAGNDEVVVLKNKLILAVTNKLTKLGYFDSYTEEGYYLRIRIAPNKITSIRRFSKPGQRKYASYRNFPKIIGGVGFSIITTPKGVMTNIEAMREKVGGEVLFQVYT